MGALPFTASLYDAGLGESSSELEEDDGEKSSQGGRSPLVFERWADLKDSACGLRVDGVPGMLSTEEEG